MFIEISQKLFIEFLFIFSIIGFLLIWSGILLNKHKASMLKQKIYFFYALSFSLPLFFLFLYVFSFFCMYNSLDYSIFFNTKLYYILNYYSYFSRVVFFFILSCILIIATKAFPKVIIKNRSTDVFIEFLWLIIFLSFFCTLLLSVWDLALSYMVLEGISFTSLILIAHLFTRSSVEAALKYLIFNIISSGFFILGIFFIFYSELLFYNVSDISFTEISNVLYTLKESEFIVIKIAINCVLLSFFFKLGVFPLHTWIPDVYEGTWDLVMFILATAVKVVYFFFFIKLFSYVFFSWFDSYVYVLLFGGIGSIHYGCFGALNQEKVKRMLAYTSIGQMGFAFLGLSSGSVTGFSSSLFHIFSYVLTLSLFFIGYLYITSSMNVELSYISDLTGLSRKYPILSLILTITLLSMAGLPPFIGFFTKYYIFVSLMDKGYYLLTLYSIIISVITSFIYLRLIKLIWFDFLLESGLVQTQGFTEITLLKLDEILLISGISNINKVKLKPILYILTCIFEFLIYLIILAYILYVALFMFIPELYFEFLTKMCISLINPF